jgi:DNA primase
MKTENLDFREALETLAKRAGIELKAQTAVSGAVRAARQGQKAAMDAALQFFRAQYDKSTRAREYCTRRGLPPDAVEQWEIGYAPDGGEALATYLKKAGYSLPECRDLFLVDQDASGGYFDKFRGRLIFPIRDERGDVVAFGGRLLGDGHPKYINSGDTPLYRKSRVLYGLHRAREKMGKSRRAILVEGYLDVIACHRAGLETAVASLGTALTDDQAKLLKRYCDGVVVLYDSDEAGQKATLKALEVLEGSDLRTRVASTPEGSDPDTLLASEGPAALQSALDTLLTPLDFRLAELERRVDAKEEVFWEEAVRLLAAAPSEMELERHVVRMGGFYPDLRDPVAAQSAIRSEVAKIRRPATGRAMLSRSRATQVPITRPKMSSAEQAVLCAVLDPLLREPAWRALADDADLFTSGQAVRLRDALVQSFEGPPSGSPAVWLAGIESEEARSDLADLAFTASPEGVGMAYLKDAIERLRHQREERALHKLKESASDDQSLQDLHLRLRRQKGRDED